jgi:flagellar protein FliS
MNGAMAAYRSDAVTTATPGQLVVMLYDRVVTALDRVEVALGSEPQNLEVAHRELTHAQAVVTELMQSLDLTAGQVARSLASLYEYCHHQLVKANMSKTYRPAEPVRTIFADLRGAWASVVADTDSIPA